MLTSPASTLELPDIQGYTLKGYAKHPYAAYLVLHVLDPIAARRWIGLLLPRVPSAHEKAGDVALHLAFTHEGLRALGLPKDALDTFATEFQEGMAGDGTGHRPKILGDVDDAAPANWDWGGGRGPPSHVLLAVFARTQESLDALLAQERARLPRSGLGETRFLPATPARDDRKEHFGFRDGIAQPVIAGTRRAAGEDPANVIAPGEFILGYPNEYAKLPDSPSIASRLDPKRILKPLEGEDGRSDLGRNGSYLVFRQMDQKVAEFWHWMADHAAARTQPSDPSAKVEAAIHLASKAVGRWPSGAPLALHPDRDDPQAGSQDAFGYHGLDAAGERCPIGAHVRRSNPRDALVADDPASSIEVSRRHRILRRGRAYGPPLVPGMELEKMIAAADDRQERGLHFICLNASLSRQFEFVQHTWINNPKFGGLYNDPDPLVANQGKDSDFTVQACPVRRKHHGVPRFVLMRGGAYFFVPGAAALRFLSTL